MVKLYFGACTKDTEHEAARELAESAFRELFGRQAILTHDASGKPRFEGEDAVFVSISHTDGCCLAVISDSEVGGDIELMKGGGERLMRLARRYFTVAEADYVSLSPDLRFYEVWCKKESYVKFTGEGLSRRLDSFSVLSSPDVRYDFFTRGEYAVAVCRGWEEGERGCV